MEPTTPAAARATRPDNARTGGETVEVVGRVSQRHAAVARRVLVPALETLAGVAEQERPRCHQVAPEGRPVLKGAAHDDPDRHRRVPFFKRTVPTPARAQHVLDGPTVPPRHESARGPPRGSARLAPGQGLIQVRSNFSQDEASHPQISYSNVEGRGLILNSGRTWTKTRTP